VRFQTRFFRFFRIKFFLNFAHGRIGRRSTIIRKKINQFSDQIFCYSRSKFQKFGVFVTFRESISHNSIGRCQPFSQNLFRRLRTTSLGNRKCASATHDFLQIFKVWSEMKFCSLAFRAFSKPRISAFSQPTALAFHRPTKKATGYEIA